MTKRLTPEGRREMLAVLKAFYDAVSDTGMSPANVDNAIRELMAALAHQRGVGETKRA